MSCFGGRVSPDLWQNCCNSNVLCEFNGDLSSVVTEPIYVQKVYDAVLFNLQGMKTVQNQSFYPCIPHGHRVKRVIDIMVGIIGIIALIPVTIIVKLAYVLTGDFETIFYGKSN